MAKGCGCGCGGATKTFKSGNSDLPGYGEQAEDILEGDKQLSLMEALQMIAAIATIVGLLKYLFRS